MIFIMDYFLLCLSLLNFVIQIMIWSQLFGKMLRIKSNIVILAIILNFNRYSDIIIWVAKLPFILLKYYFYISMGRSYKQEENLYTY